MAQAKRPLTIAQSVAAQIREQILKREISGGEPLRQGAIAKSLGTSIIPVREALRQLEAEGLVELHTHRGAVATRLTLDQALEWIHLRRLIETDLISDAMDNTSTGLRRYSASSTKRWTRVTTSPSGARTTGSSIRRCTRRPSAPRP